MVAVLDAWAVLALLQAEPAGPRVRDVVSQGGAGISWINLGEVHCQLARRQGQLTGDPEIVALPGEVEVVDLRSVS